MGFVGILAHWHWQWLGRDAVCGIVEFAGGVCWIGKVCVGGMRGRVIVGGSTVGKLFSGCLNCCSLFLTSNTVQRQHWERIQLFLFSVILVLLLVSFLLLLLLFLCQVSINQSFFFHHIFSSMRE